MDTNPQFVIAIVPTLGRESLNRAISSVFKQTQPPEEIVVVFDEKPPECEKNITLLKNERTRNLSGAVNTAIHHIIAKEYVPEETFVAILDDDDEWDKEYLESCLAVAKTGKNWIISGITRYDNEHRDGIKLEIPSEIEARTFLTTNPNIQGSNLFVRLDLFLKAGGFDEMFVSTTDRDICFRLASLPCTDIGFLRKHLVFHYALSTDRLSTASSPRKKEGLEYFYHKYGPIMTEEEIRDFMQRSKALFGIEIDAEKGTEKKSNYKSLKAMIGASKNLSMPRILVGIISDKPKQLANLLCDLARLIREGLKVEKVIILHKREDKEFFLHSCGEIDMELINEASIEVPKIFHSSGIGPARQKLHIYLSHLLDDYDEKPIVWLLDDDIRLSYLDGNGTERKLDAKKIVQGVQDALKQNLDVGIGIITGDPPIPAFSMIRTNLIDYYYNHIRKLDGFKIDFIFNMPDYYYDYSERHTNHLEMPVWKESKMPLSSLLYGKTMSRPVIFDPENSKIDGLLTRGGNTFIFNPNALSFLFNVSPVLNGKMCRRADTVWEIVCKYLFNQKIGQVNIPVLHERKTESILLSGQAFLSDTVGRASSRALVEYFRTGTDFKEFFFQKIKKYLVDYKITFYRIRGLISMIEMLDITAEDRESLKYIQELFSQESLEHLISSIENIDRSAIDEFFSYIRKNGVGVLE